MCYTINVYISYIDLDHLYIVTYFLSTFEMNNKIEYNFILFNLCTTFLMVAYIKYPAILNNIQKRHITSVFPLALFSMQQNIFFSVDTENLKHFFLSNKKEETHAPSKSLNEISQTVNFYFLLIQNKRCIEMYRK